MTLSIFDAARDSAEQEALLCQGQRLTFAALAERCAVRFRELEALGVRAGQTQAVAIRVDNSLPMFEYLYALIAVGVPVLPLHPRLTAPEAALLLHLAGAELEIDAKQAAPHSHLACARPGSSPVDSRHALALVPSSGSSGTPKLVELSRGAFLALAQADRQRIAPLTTDRALLCLPLSHVGGLSVLVRSLLARRACVVFQPAPKGLLHSLGELAHSIESERISLLSLVPPVLGHLLRAEPQFGFTTRLRALLLGGQACPPELFEQARARAIPVLTSYGLTETCSQVSTLAFPPPSDVPSLHGVLSSGHPLPGQEVRVRDGLIEVRGPTLFTRYVGSASALDSEGFFKTNDRGELDPEHGLFVFGRGSELIVSGGENIDPTEVEHALLACPGVDAACVFAVKDADFGQRVAVALELSPRSTFDELALFSALSQRLASYKQPRTWCLFDALPRLASGKLDRARIRLEAEPRLRVRTRAIELA